MPSSQFTEQTITLQLKIHSNGSKTRIKKWLLGIQGVRRVYVDDINGLVIVLGTIDPHTLLMMLEKIGVKAEIYGHQRRDENDTDLAAIMLKQLPENSAGLFKSVEVITFDFRDHPENCGYGNRKVKFSGENNDVANNMPRGCPNGNRNFSNFPQPAGYWGFSPWVAVGVPSAPPLPDNSHAYPPPPPPPQPPPPETNPFYWALSDDYISSSCTIM